MLLQSFVCNGCHRRYHDNQRCYSWMNIIMLVCSTIIIIIIISIIMIFSSRYNNMIVNNNMGNHIIMNSSITSSSLYDSRYYNHKNSSRMNNPTAKIITNRSMETMSNNSSSINIINNYDYQERSNSSNSSFARILRFSTTNINNNKIKVKLISDKEKIISSSSITTTTISFSVIGDAPYSYDQSILLRDQILYNISNKESLFLIHVGDIRCDERCGNPKCKISDYTNVSSILQLSAIPVFVLIGDNDWNDCPNPDEGLKYWNDTFLLYDKKYWNSKKVIGNTIRRDWKRNENFSYIINGTLFIGINLVGGTVLDSNEWHVRLTQQYYWVKKLIRLHVLSNTQPFYKRIVIFGHAYPNINHNPFFIPLSKLIQNELNNTIPMLYIHGDLHQWQNETNYMNQTSFQRISVVGEVLEYPLHVTINTTNPSINPTDVFILRRSYF